MTGRIRNIVIGIEDTQNADPHLAPAIELAKELGATLHVVHAYDLPDPSLYPYLELSVFSAEAIQQMHERAQRDLEKQVQQITNSTRVVCRPRPGPAALVILNVADEVEADLIIVGTTNRGKIERAILGTTAQRVLRSARRPVLVSRRPGHSIRRVLLATDLSALSVKTNEIGAEMGVLLAPGGHPELRAVFVVGYDMPLLVPMDHEAIEAAAEMQLDEHLGELAGPGNVAQKVRVGQPITEIIAEARDWHADLLVLGTHGRTGASRFLIGSVAESVLKRVECSVLVVPTVAVEAPEMDEAEEDMLAALTADYR
jgi:nucleotide-binding universal stress UspA family protein